MFNCNNKYWALVLAFHAALGCCVIAQANSAGAEALSVVATCNTFVDRNESATYVIKTAALNLVEFNGMLFIKQAPREDAVIVEDGKGRRQDGFMTKYFVGDWFEFIPDSRGAMVPTKATGASFAPDDRSVYVDYADDGNIIEATAKFASGMTYFVGRHWDHLTIRYEKKAKWLHVKTVGGLWGLPSNVYSDFTMQCN